MYHAALQSAKSIRKLLTECCGYCNKDISGDKRRLRLDCWDAQIGMELC